MNDDMQQLKIILQMLALPVTGQVRLVPDDCARVEALAQAFIAAHHAVDVDSELMPEQARTLARLDNQLVRLRHESTPPLCSELALRQSGDWRQVRTMAREALVRLRWPLELPWQVIGEGEPCLN
jgi:hypothetical protein